MFTMAEADTHLSNEELITVVTMKDVFTDYTEQDIITLYREYKVRFEGKGFAEICNVMVRQIPEELYMGTLSVLADVAVTDFNIDLKEGSFISIVASAMGISDVSTKTLLLASLSKKLMVNAGSE